MHLHLTLSQLTLLAGTALIVAAVLVLLIYLLHSAAAQQRSGAQFRAKPPRAENEKAFLAAAIQGVIADLKTQQKNLESRLRSAEEQARAAERTLEAMAREIPEGLIVIGRDGCVTRANRAVSELLKIDLWSRRPYGEILGRDSPLTTLIQSCFESARPARQIIEAGSLSRTPGAKLEVSVAPIEGISATALEGVICLLRKAGSI